MNPLLPERLAKLTKAAILIGLVVIFAFFIQEVWSKFTEKATNYRQSFTKVDSYDTPTVTLCFAPSMKPSMKKHYNLSSLDWHNLVTSSSSIKSMTKMFHDSYYQLGRDFTLTNWNYKMELLEVHDGTENYFEYPEGTFNNVNIQRFHSYLSGLCYSIKFLMMQDPDIFFGFGLILNDSLKLNKDEPKKVETILTSKSNSYGIVRGTWFEGDQLDMSISLKKKGSVLANIKEYRHHLLSSPPHCEQISHYECLGHGLLKVLDEGKLCISSVIGHLCVNTCPNVCIPLAFQNLIELVVSNVSIPICETGEENKCMATIFWHHLIELSKNCSSSCTILNYKGAESG